MRTTEQRRAAWTPERRANVSEKVRAHVAKRKAEFVIPERKVCRVCKAEKALADFPMHPTMKDGHLNHCQGCINTKVRDRNAARPRKKRRFKRMLYEQFLASMPADYKLKCKECGIEKPLKEFHASKAVKLGVRNKCKKCVLARIADDHRKNPEIRRARNIEWRKNNPLRALEINRAHAAKHKEERRIARKELRLKNIEREREHDRNYSKNNPHIRRAKNARRRSREMNATPRWLTWIQKAQIQEFYEIAIAREMQTGEKYHVDHIVPLGGETVCGLEVPWNLQVLTEFENCSKHNRLIEGSV